MGKRSRVKVMEVPWKRRIGRPNRWLLDNIRNDLSERELPGEEAQTRVKLMRFIINIDTYRGLQVAWDAEEEKEEDGCFHSR